MSDNDLKNTQKKTDINNTQISNDNGDNNLISNMTEIPPKLNNRKFPGWLVALSVMALVAIGLMGGYGSGINQRFTARDTQLSGQLDEQFQLGELAYKAGNYDLAKQYFEFVLQTDSNYPGIQTAYTDLLLRLQVSPTPLYSPTPHISPTPDLRGAEEIYNSAFQLLNSNDWNGAISNLDSLRKTNPNYRTAEVDGMYYLALRQRGIEKITTVCQNVNLEGGIYDLTLAERFIGTGNLDSYADSLRTYARLYIIGASFWDQDWVQAQNFFSQVMIGFPNLTDSSCMSATRRWLVATFKIADQELLYGNPCHAEDQYAFVFTNVNDPYNATVFPTATAAANLCNGGGSNGSGEPTVHVGVTPAGFTETPTGIPTETLTLLPSETPTIGSIPTCDPSTGTPCP
jgi:tetratricopeptide (TPR) repeat protein